MQGMKEQVGGLLLWELDPSSCWYYKLSNDEKYGKGHHSSLFGFTIFYCYNANIRNDKEAKGPNKHYK